MIYAPFHVSFWSCQGCSFEVVCVIVTWEWLEGEIIICPHRLIFFFNCEKHVAGRRLIHPGATPARLCMWPWHHWRRRSGGVLLTDRWYVKLPSALGHFNNLGNSGCGPGHTDSSSGILLAPSTSHSGKPSQSVGWPRRHRFCFPSAVCFLFCTELQVQVCFLPARVGRWELPLLNGGWEVEWEGSEPTSPSAALPKTGLQRAGPPGTLLLIYPPGGTLGHPQRSLAR